MTADKDALLRECLSFAKYHEHEPWRHKMDEVAADLVARITAALAEKECGWIKCSERLPDTDKTVIVDGGIAYQRNGGWFSLTGIEYPGRLIQWNVTHWRPLPPLPKGDE